MIASNHLYKGKNKKLALIAVCNKLLKQAFAIVKSGLPYDANYKRALELKKYKMHLFFTSVLLNGSINGTFSNFINTLKI